jgi:hypothetical protein
MTTDYPHDADGDALRRVAAGGGDMSTPMDIDFFVAASDEATAKVIADKAAELGYRTEICFDDDECLVDAWTCECTKAMVPTFQAIIVAQAELDAIARPLGAHTDGWGTSGGGEQYTMTEAEPAAAVPPPPRRRFQYGLRSLFVFVTAFAVVTAIVVTPTRTQRIAQEIYDMQGSYAVKENGPTWFRQLFGRTIKSREGEWHNTIVGPFDSLEWVELGFWRRPCDVRDEWLDNLAGQTSLQDLDLGLTHVTDDGIFRLRDLPNLRKLNLRRLAISDWTLTRIATFTKLEELNLCDTPISSRLIFSLRMLPNLKVLWLAGTQIDDSAITDLKCLRSLEILRLEETNMTWAGVNELSSARPKCHIIYRPREPRSTR